MAEPDPFGLMDEFLKLREVLAGMVAGFKADGFTDEQARTLVVRIFTTPTPTEET